MVPIRYVDTSSKSPAYVNINNHRVRRGLRRSTRAFTNTLSAYIRLTYDKVEFTDTMDNTDFNQKAGARRVSRTANARTVLDAAGGYTQLRAHPTRRARPTTCRYHTPAARTWQCRHSHV